jgi:putative ABC transport system permease protein
LSRVEQEIASLPGVMSVGTASAGPLFGGRETWEMQIEGRDPDDRPSIRWFDVSPGYFAALGVAFVRGGDFDATDVFGAPTSAIVNETLANRFWPGENPIGKRLVFPHGDERETFTVKGVVRDVAPIRPGTAPEPELYWSNRQAPRPFTYVVVRTNVPPGSVASGIRERLAGVHRDVRPSAVATMNELVDGELRAPRFSMTLIVVFGFSALALAAIGTYGLLAYFVEQRRKDIGIRLALGADRGLVVRKVLRDGITLALTGVAFGVAGSLLLGRAMHGLLTGVSPSDVTSLGVSVALVLLVGVVACLLPAIRASRVDPAVALAAE